MTSRHLVWLLALFLALPLRAADPPPVWFRSHTVQEGESLSLIAKKYYGAPWKYVYLTAANKLSGSSVEPGTALRIPDIVKHTVQAGEGFTQISSRYFGKKDFFRLILWANGLTAKAALKPGMELIIPHILRHSVRPGDTLEKIAELYYRDKSMATMLKVWNQLKTATPRNPASLKGIPTLWFALRVGVEIDPQPEAPQAAVPANTPTVSPTAAPSSLAMTPPTIVTPVETGFDVTSMVLVKELIRAGKYAQALEVLKSIPAASFKNPAQRSDFHWQQLLCHVGLGDKRAAIQALEQYLDDGGENLETLRRQDRQHSPKTRWVIEQVARKRAQR